MKRHLFANNATFVHWRMHRDPETNAVMREEGRGGYVRRGDEEERSRVLLETPLPEDVLRREDGSIVLWVDIHRGGGLSMDVTVPQPRCTMDILKAIHSVYTTPLTPELLARLQAVPDDTDGYVAGAASRMAASKQVIVADVLGQLKYYEGLRSKPGRQGHYEVLAGAFDWTHIHTGFDPDGGLTAEVLQGRPVYQVARSTVDTKSPLEVCFEGDRGVVALLQSNMCIGQCGELGKLLCPACKRDMYCSRDCQEADYGRHEQDCVVRRTGRD